jgi:hypothetical protein
MQTRRLRLGDVVDDYCPRERRLSNHVIVAMVDDTIKQTRCATCDFEHPYKEAKVPARRKKKDAPPALFQQVLDNVAEGTPVASVLVEPKAPVPAAKIGEPPARLATKGVLRPNGQTSLGQASGLSEPVLDGDEALPPADEREPVLAVAAPPAGDAEADRPVTDEEAPLHRRPLIRATLPRPVGDVPVRQPPSFTIREAAAARPNKFRFKSRPPGGQRQGRPQSAGGAGHQSRPAGGRGPQSRGTGKKGGGHQPHRAGGHQPSRGPKGPHGNKRFK